MIYAPEVYIVEDKNYTEILFNEKFLDYLSNQVDNHILLGVRDRAVFLRTIREYYPEFTPKLPIMRGEIKDVRERNKKSFLKLELEREIEKRGIPDYLSEDLITEGITAEELKRNIAISKKCLEKGYHSRMCLFCINNDFDPDHVLASTVDKILNTIGKDSEGIALALVNGHITPEEFEHILSKAKDLIDETASTKIFYVRVSCEELMNQKLLSK